MSTLASRRSMRRRRWLLLLVIGLTALCFYLWFYEDQDAGGRVIDRFAYYCQFLENPLTGEEGPISGPKLLGLVVLFRHGERSPLAHLAKSEVADCSAFFDQDRREFQAYVDVVGSAAFARFFRWPAGRGFDLHPHWSTCSPGNLTAEGALQLYKLGTYLRQRYAETTIFSGQPPTTLRVTKYARAFQSAAAFAAGFFLPHQRQVRPLTVDPNPLVTFCGDAKSFVCQCEHLDAKISEVFAERTAIFQQRYANLAGRIRHLSMLLGIKETASPVEFMDVLLGKYVCRRQPLPCFEGACITADLFTAASDATTELFWHMRESSDFMRTLFAVQTLPFVQHVARALASPWDATRLDIFSGHDVSLLPIIGALDLPYDSAMPPPYTSRLVVELYETPGESAAARMLLNGRDVTTKIPGCERSALCQRAAFEELEKTLLERVGGLKPLKAFCER